MYFFYTRQAEKFSKSGGSIYPGFHDFYAQGASGENLVRNFVLRNVSKKNVKNRIRNFGE